MPAELIHDYCSRGVTHGYTGVKPRVFMCVVGLIVLRVHHPSRLACLAERHTHLCTRACINRTNQTKLFVPFSITTKHNATTPRAAKLSGDKQCPTKVIGGGG